ncbi:signal transduction histidine kinase [Frigoribacterium sp. PvP120]|uniref:sensor histidine kinase n=1 Tax=unclassified Frigoribacterium TaxID=2627005 RepID=UPI001AE6246C|nr:histidine kinase [Frigoribacterium sp. PvP121]MBP1242368.1 signal transduction histidine kinase [Frigoribacterium sp. PvP121]
MTQERPITVQNPYLSPPARPGGYRRRWRELPRELGYVALSAVLVVIVSLGAALFFHVLSGSSDSLVTLVFLAVVVFGALWLARWFGTFEVLRLRWASDRPIRPVDWTPNTAWGRSSSRFVRAVSVFANPHYWLYLLYALIIFPTVAGVTTFVLALLLGGPLLFVLGIVVFFGAVTPFQLTDWPSAIGTGGAAALVIVALALFAGVVLVYPYVVHAVVVVHQAIAAAVLGGFRSEQLEVELADREISRTAALSAEGTALRRLERDIHDGPQQRLVRLQMDLAAAARAVDADPEKSKALIEEARVQSREALEELRALSRGFAPPLLLDRGLVAALESLVDRAVISTTLVNRVPAHVVVPADIERNAYFIASELVTNIGKHSEASSADLALRTRTAPDGVGTLLELVVTDDGRGGAGLRDGHGLAGVQERLVGLGGFLDISSPQGGPTIVTVSIPLVTDLGSSVAPPSADDPTSGEPTPTAATPGTSPTLPLPPYAAVTEPLPDVSPTAVTEPLPRGAGRGRGRGATGGPTAP